jgi:hypothetical protein
VTQFAHWGNGAKIIKPFKYPTYALSFFSLAMWRNLKPLIIKRLNTFTPYLLSESQISTRVKFKKRQKQNSIRVGKEPIRRKDVA